MQTIIKRLPIAKTEIKELIEGNFCYVDKTKFIKDLLDDGHGYYFLSRPRRFGKSLLIDTIRAAFEAEKEIFNGLYIENNWDWSIKYPVITISFGAGTVDTNDQLEIRLNELLNRNIDNNKIEIKNVSIPGRFEELIKKLFDKFNLPVVILIDEYDKPILDNITNENANKIKEGLSSFYSVLKDASKYLKFVFLTGVSKFSKTNIFSKLNNITDISLVPKYADICGYTQTDLETTFADYLYNVDLEKVKNWYDGYNFLGSNLYNPYDVLLFLWEKRYRCFWFETGTPTFLLELIKKRNYYVPNLERIQISEFEMGEFDINNIKLEILLYQTGYLTIEKLEEINENYIYTLKIPNKEVRKGLNEYLLTAFYASGVNAYERTNVSLILSKALNQHNLDDLKLAFTTLFAGIPNNWYTNNNIAQYEGFYCSLFYAFFAALGVEIKSEDTTNKGRIDFTIITQTAIFIFEIKMKHINKKALAQIKERQYHQKYLSEKKDIYLIGLEFDETDKNISTFEYEKVIV